MGIFTGTQQGTVVSRLWKFVPVLAVFACLFTSASRAAEIGFTDTCVLAQQPPAGVVPSAGEVCVCACEESRNADSCASVQPPRAIPEPCVYAEVMPVFEGGGLLDFQRWVCQRVEYPADAFRRKAEGRVVCAFVVETDGMVSSVRAVRAPDALLAAEVERVVSSSPRWTAGRQDGVPVRVQLMLPVDFRVQEQVGAAVQTVGKENVLSLSADTLPRFRNGGIEVFRGWVMEHLRYPWKAIERCVEGCVVCSFVVEKDGAVSSIEVLRSPDPLLSKEAVRIVSASPRWTPAGKDGKAVRVRYNLPVVFDLQGANFSDQKAPIEGEIIYCGEADADVDIDTDTPAPLPQVMPRFEGHYMDAFLPWARSHMHYPAEAVERRAQGRVVCSFVIGADGSVTSVEVLQSADPVLSKEVVSMLSASPRWTPARRDGKAVRVRYKLAMVFRPEGAELPRSDALDGPKAPRRNTDTDQSFLSAEVMPRFKGRGLDAFGRWIHSRMRYPPELVKRKVEGRVDCTFVIDTDGSVTSVEVLRSPDPALVEEVVRALSASPRWTPGMQNGKPVKVRFNWSVRFGIHGWEPDPEEAATEERRTTAKKLLQPQSEMSRPGRDVPF